MKYKCLILDHDDTAVDSTSVLHYPAHIETMKELRPGEVIISCDDWFLKNFHPGIMEYMQDELKFTDNEIKREYAIWQEYIADKNPRFYPGFLEIIREFKESGGRVAVVSHSTKEIIQRDYNSVGAGDIPEIIYGWHMDKKKRKPSVYPVQEILKEFGLEKEDALIIDDLKPAVIMSKDSGIDIAGAGWGHQIPEIVEYMKKNCNYYFYELDELREVLLS